MIRTSFSEPVRVERHLLATVEVGLEEPAGAPHLADKHVAHLRRAAAAGGAAARRVGERIPPGVLLRHREQIRKVEVVEAGVRQQARSCMVRTWGEPHPLRHGAVPERGRGAHGAAEQRVDHREERRYQVHVQRPREIGGSRVEPPCEQARRKE